MSLLLVSPAVLSLLFTLPQPAMLRYIDNVAVACLASPIVFTASVETYDATCGAESIPGVWLFNAMTLAVVGAILGGIALHTWLRTRRRQTATDI